MKIVFLTPFNTVSLLLQMTLRFNGYIENGYECDFFISLLYAVFMTFCGNFGFGINLGSGILILANGRRGKNTWNIYFTNHLPPLCCIPVKGDVILCYAMHVS